MIKKVLFVVTKANWGGAQHYVFDLATGLPKEQCEALLAYGQKGKLAAELAQAGILTHQIESLKRDVSFGSDIRSFFELLKLFFKIRPDVVHLNSSKGGALGALAARMAGVSRIIFTSHGWAFNEERPSWQKKIIKSVQWLTVLLSHHTIVVSQFDFEQSKEWPLVAKKITAIHNGISPFSLLSRTDARRDFVKNDTQLQNFMDVCWIGTNAELHKNKGLDYLLQAFARVPQDPYPSICMIVGGGEERDMLEKLVQELGIAGRVFFIGFVDDARAHLSAFDIFTLTSRKEGLPYGVLEAGMAGLPVVASNIGGISEIITPPHEGLLTDSGDTQAIAEALSLLINEDEMRAELGDALKQKVTKEFSLSTMVRETLDLYRV